MRPYVHQKICHNHKLEFIRVYQQYNGYIKYGHHTVDYDTAMKIDDMQNNLNESHKHKIEPGKPDLEKSTL